MPLAQEAMNNADNNQATQTGNAAFRCFLGEQRNVKRLHLTCLEFDFHNFRASSVVEFNPVAQVRG
jgi:hypothetical protein